VPQVDNLQQVAVIFTSGSTGIPQPHPKTWGALVGCVQSEAVQLGLPSHTPCVVVSTVPPQHMFGFESTVLMPWHNGHAVAHPQPFYPADICAALAAVPAPRVLISSPVHLRALLDSGLTMPPLATVVCATAPLSDSLARAIEARWNAPLMEIFGSTETGQIASRRTAHTAQWRLFPGVELVQEGERVRARGAHVETAVALSDVIEPVGDTHFLLHGRIADMINIAGKRHSLASLNHLLNAIPGVVDGTFYMPDDSASGQVSRLAACVVAPGLNATDLLAALRQHLDPVFLPRPLLFVDALPRNSTGKLPREALQALFEHRGAPAHD
jgi:acyl-coenzyme A synthetase/AMP-(fatty) acid ligase